MSGWFAKDIGQVIEITNASRCGKVPVASVNVGYNDPFDTEQRQSAALIVRAVNSHAALVEALREIVKGEGEFSRNPLTHAENTIDNMKEIARAALKQAEES